MNDEQICSVAETDVEANVEAVLLKHLRENFLPQGNTVPLDPKVHLFDAGILDSAGVLSVILFVETTFGLTIPDEDLLPENFSSVEAATRYINARLNGSNPSNLDRGKYDVEDQKVPDLGSR